MQTDSKKKSSSAVIHLYLVRFRMFDVLGVHRLGLEKVVILLLGNKCIHWIFNGAKLQRFVLDDSSNNTIIDNSLCIAT